MRPCRGAVTRRVRTAGCSVARPRPRPTGRSCLIATSDPSCRAPAAAHPSSLDPPGANGTWRMPNPVKMPSFVIESFYLQIECASARQRNSTRTHDESPQRSGHECRDSTDDSRVATERSRDARVHRPEQTPRRYISITDSPSRPAVRAPCSTRDAAHRPTGSAFAHAFSFTGHLLVVGASGASAPRPCRQPWRAPHSQFAPHWPPPA